MGNQGNQAAFNVGVVGNEDGPVQALGPSEKARRFEIYAGDLRKRLSPRAHSSGAGR